MAATRPAAHPMRASSACAAWPRSARARTLCALIITCKGCRRCPGMVLSSSAKSALSRRGVHRRTPSLRCQEGFLGQARGRSSVQLRGRRHRCMGTRGKLLHCQPQQRRDFRCRKASLAGPMAASSRSLPLPQLVPERVAAVHAAIPICRGDQVEPGRENPNRPALRDDRRSGSSHLVRPAPRAQWEHWPTGRQLWLSDIRSR